MLCTLIGAIILSINMQVVLNMHLYDDIGDASSSLRGSTSSFFVGLPFFPSASVFPVSLPLFFLRPCLIHARMPDWGMAYVHGHTFLHSWIVCDDIGSLPAAWKYVPVQSYSCSLRVFYRTLVVGKDTY